VFVCMRVCARIDSLESHAEYFNAVLEPVYFSDSVFVSVCVQTERLGLRFLMGVTEQIETGKIVK